MKDHPDDRPPWWQTTLMKDHLDVRPPWWKTTLMSDHPDERPPWCQTTPMRDHPDDRHPNEKPPCWQTTLMIDHPDERPPLLSDCVVVVFWNLSLYSSIRMDPWHRTITTHGPLTQDNHAFAVWLNLFDAKLSPKRYWRRLNSQDVGEEGGCT